MRAERVVQRRRIPVVALVLTVLAAGCSGVSDPGVAASEEPQDESAETSADADGQGFPHDQLRFIVPYAPGAGADGTSRPLGELMSQELGVPVVFENIEGAGAAVGTTEIFRSEPDGATIGLSTDFAMGLQPHFNDDLQYTGWQDFDILLKAPAQPMIMVARPDSPYEDLADVVAAAEDRPGEVSIATAGSLSTSAITSELLSNETGAEFNVVPFTGGAAEGRTALLGGRVELGMSGVSSYMGLIEAGDLRPLAIFWDERSELLPDLATAAELGMDVVGASNYYVVAPKGLPDDIKELLMDVARGAAEDEGYRQLMIDQGGIPLAIPGADAEAELTAFDATIQEIMPRLEAADG